MWGGRGKSTPQEPSSALQSSALCGTHFKGPPLGDRILRGVGMGSAEKQHRRAVGPPSSPTCTARLHVGCLSNFSHGGGRETIPSINGSRFEPPEGGAGAAQESCWQVWDGREVQLGTACLPVCDSVSPHTPPPVLPGDSRSTLQGSGGSRSGAGPTAQRNTWGWEAPARGGPFSTWPCRRGSWSATGPLEQQVSPLCLLPSPPDRCSRLPMAP